MPDSSRPLRKLGFLTIGLFDPADPAAGHQSTLQIIDLGERLGFDSAWLRHRHLQFGISSPIAIMAAASQRTSRIELGTAVTPMDWENPLRLAEDLATVDLLAGGRINPGLSVGEPMHYDTVKHELYPDSAELEDFGYARVQRLARLIAGEPVREFSGKQGVVEEFSNRVEPHSSGLRERLWHGAASQKSALWAGENGFNLLSSSVIFPEVSSGTGLCPHSAITDQCFPSGRRGFGPEARTRTGLARLGGDPHRFGVGKTAGQVPAVRR